jgi:tricarballylate dehydrogenase
VRQFVSEQYDVVIVGAGNAAMSAAHAALENGVSVCILEKAPREDRGGNSMLTGHLRFAYDSVDQLMPLVTPSKVTPEMREKFEKRLPKKSRDDLWNEIMAVTDGRSDPDLLRYHVDQSLATVQWLNSKGHTWIPSTEEPTGDGNLLRLDGGGGALQERNFAFMEANPKVTVKYRTALTELLTDGRNAVAGVKALSTEHGLVDIYAKSVVLACGGFEANAEMRARYLGRYWDDVHLRGVPFNTGDGLRAALAIGAIPYGSWNSAHAAPVDWAMRPTTTPSQRRGERARYSRYAYLFSVMVNRDGVRFVDEAQDTRDFTYAKMGRSILEQPGGKAFQIIDAKVRKAGLIPHPYDSSQVWSADTIENLAAEIGLNPGTLVRTIEEFNAGVPEGSEARPSAFGVDGVSTVGLTIPKSNYAMRIDTPPFEAFPVRCGMTFTFGGLKIDLANGQVQNVSGDPIGGLYTAGEMVGGLWYWNYPSGSGMMSGATFGRLAGTGASLAAKQQ